MTDLVKSGKVEFTPAGTGAVATDVQSKLRESVSVKDFGAVGDGVTDDTAAINAASLSLSSGGCLHFPSGTYRVPASGSPIRPQSNVIFMGDGVGASVLWLDTSSGTGSDLVADLTGPITHFTMRDLTLRGSWAVNNNAQTSDHLVEIKNALSVDFERCEFTLSNGFGVALNNCEKVRIVDCTVSKTNRDGIAVWNCPDTLIHGNIISDTDDDCISVHTDDSASLPRSKVVVTGNSITSSQGIKVLGGKSVVVSGNVLNRCYAYGLKLSNDSTFDQGNTPGVGVTVTDNVIADVMSRVQGGAGDKYYMLIAGGQRNIVDGSAAPGMPDTTTGTFVSLFGTNKGYFYTNNTDDPSVASPGGYYWNIRGNQLIRTLPAVAAYSDWGYGTLFCGNAGTGEYTGAVSESALNVNGLLIEGYIKNANIDGNIIATTGERAVYFNVGSTPPVMQFDNFTIRGNTISNFRYGVMWPAGTATAQGINVIDNFFDGDPLHIDANRGANGTYLADSFPQGVYCPFSYGFVVVRNQFRNVNKPIVTTGANPIIVIADNYLRCDPSVVNFSTSNRGIGFCPRASDQYRYLIVGSDPAAATYGNMLNATLFDSNAIPTIGKYVTGHIVKNNTPSVLGTGGSQYIVSGWIRMNIGSAHILNTDWRELRCLTGT